MANWKDVAELIAPYAPTAGRFLGGLSGFPGGGLIGQKIGEAIAMAFGVAPTPDAVADAIQSAPAADVAAKLEAVEAEAKSRWEAMARIAESGDKAEVEKARIISETQRAEIVAGVSPWHWRHLIGYLVLCYGAMQLAGMVAIYVHVAFFAADPAVVVDAYSKTMNATTTFTVGLFGLLGWVASDTTKLKTTALTGEPPASVIEQVKAVVKAPAKPAPARPVR